MHVKTNEVSWKVLPSAPSILDLLWFCGKYITGFSVQLTNKSHFRKSSHMCAESVSPHKVCKALDLTSSYTTNYANPVYGVATISHQVRCLRWGHPSLFHTATSLLIRCKMFCMRDISYRLIYRHWLSITHNHLMVTESLIKLIVA